jgi:hypothetical protein
VWGTSYFVQYEGLDSAAQWTKSGPYPRWGLTSTGPQSLRSAPTGPSRTRLALDGDSFYGYVDFARGPGGSAGTAAGAIDGSPLSGFPARRRRAGEPPRRPAACFAIRPGAEPATTGSPSLSRSVSRGGAGRCPWACRRAFGSRAYRDGQERQKPTCAPRVGRPRCQGVRRGPACWPRR